MALRFAAFDLGSHSNSLLVCEGDRVLCELRQVTDLKKGALADGCLNSEAMTRSLASLKSLIAQAEAFQVPPEQRRAVATAAFRQAPNVDAYLKAASKLGLEVEVISGEEEAQLSYEANRSLAGGGLYVDLGGGSTEIVGPNFAQSVPFGCRHCPPEPEKCLASLASCILSEPKAVFAGGSLCSLGAKSLQLDIFDASKLQGMTISRAVLDAFAADGDEPERSAAKIARAVLAWAKLDAFILTTKGLRHGVMARLQNHKN